MSEEALWDELLALAGEGVAGEDDPENYRRAYARVARVAALCRRLGVDDSGADLLKRDDFERAELDAYFKKVWRLATLHAESRRISQMEARRGVDKDAADFRHLRESLDEARVMILDFNWLPEKRKRVCLDKLEALVRELQRARDDFDVALAGVSDPAMAASIDISRPNAFKSALRKIAIFLGPPQVDDRPQERRSLPPPDPRDEA